MQLDSLQVQIRCNERGPNLLGVTASYSRWGSVVASMQE